MATTIPETPMPRQKADLTKTDLPKGSIETPAGKISFQFIKPDRVLAVSGWQDGWLTVNDKPLYAAAHFVLGDDEQWTVDRGHCAVCHVKDNKADARCDEGLAEVALLLLRENLDSWFESTPGVQERAHLASAEAWLMRAQEDVANTEAHLKRLKQEMAERRALRDQAEANLQAVLAGPSPTP